MDEVLKEEYEGFPDLEAAFEAVKGMLFGPLDPGFVKHKFNEIVRDAKDKRDLEFSPYGVLGLARHDGELRDRKDRDHQHLTLTALLAQDGAYRRAHEAAMEALGDAGRAVDTAIETGDRVYAKLVDKIDEYLASTARLKDGRYVMIDEDGTYRDQNLDVIDPKDVGEVEGQTIRKVLPYKELKAWKAEVESNLDQLRGYNGEIGEMRERNTDDKNPLSMKEKEADTERGGAIENSASALDERMKEIEKVQEVRDQPEIDLRSPGSSGSLENLGRLDLPSAAP